MTATTSADGLPAANRWSRADGALLGAALVWGFAEATLFFVVPDLFLTFVALQRRRLALLACGAALAGALAGGATMYGWSKADHAAAAAAVDGVPFVPSPLLDRVRTQLERDGTLAVVAGAWTGRPYKLYAVEAPVAGMRAVELLVVTVPARLLRFVALTLLAATIARLVAPRWGRRTALALWAAAWTINYVVYWSLMSR